MEYLNLLLFILFPLTIVKLFSWITKSSITSLPPGPVPLPIIGNLLQLGRKPHESLTQLAKVYGPLMSLKLGSVTTVVVSSPAMAKEILQKHDQSFASRTILEAITVFDHHKVSMVWLPAVSSQWRNLRKITNSHISATQKLDSLNRQKLDDLGAYISRSASSSSVVDIGHAAFTTVLNLVSNSFFSTDVADYNSDSTFETALREGVVEAGKPNISDYIPIISFMDVQGIKRRMRNYSRIMDNTLDKIIDQKMGLGKKTKSSNSGDLLDIILDPCHENGIELQRQDIKALLKDLLMAATDTISSTVEWALAELLHNPSKMTKAQQELSNIIGRRICPGLPLAHMTTHLMIGLLLQSFDWKLENGMKPDDMNMDHCSGFSLLKATGLRVIPIKL
ncbi:hypothetical protein MKX01_009538 [Papaver californicum]|nr:hypothetical protein MKX01_036612 [Papaver californicum]KAI3925268.1 hypothetical protein MKX01_011798 [Papaver californicum]KAI3992377.1 hypothetical protein MKX01_009538 [Papaver californicum]